ncbi:MAG: hypothetical protein U9M89_02590 [Patescibacteria group bacterium]|nr:hypothetical protein [Patescibacteria group bacterium]
MVLQWIYELLSLPLTVIVGLVVGLILGIIWGLLAKKLDTSWTRFIIYATLIASWFFVTLGGVIKIGDILNGFELINPTDVLIVTFAYGALYSFGILSGTVIGIDATS